MNPHKVREICTQRLAEWTERCVEFCSTPALMICVGHGKNEGVLQVLVPTGIDDEFLIAMLRYALDHAEGARV